MALKNVQPEEEVKIPDPEQVDGPPEGFTEEEWSDLSETEKEGILSKDEDDGEAAPGLSEEELAAIADEDGDEKDEKTPDEPPAEEAAAEPAEEPPAEEKKPEETAASEAEVSAKERLSDADLLLFRPKIDETKLPAPAEEVISSDIQAKLDEIQQRYDDGELPMNEYLQKRDALNRRIVHENVSRNDAVRSEARAALTWEAEQAAFFGARPEYAKEGGVKGKAMYGALNQVIQDLDADPENAGMSGMAILVKADKIVKEIFGVAAAVPKKEPVKETSPEDKEDKGSGKKPAAKKPAAKIPDSPTLGDVPVAQANSAENPWAGIDKLQGEAYEAALERMTPEQRSRYLAAR